MHNIKIEQSNTVWSLPLLFVSKRSH